MNNIQITQKSETKKVITLISREVKCGELCKTQFIQKLLEDIITAEKYYSELIEPEIQKSKEQYIARVTERITKEAQKRYKRISNQDKYIKENLEKEISSYNNCTKDNLDYADLKVEFGKNGIASCCIISFNDALKGIHFGMSECFDYIENNKFWKGANGWKIEYESWSKDSFKSSGRPQITLILPEELQNEADRLEKGLADDIARFYSCSNYWGD